MNFYECLGVKQSATTEEIQAAFREKAKDIHPDYNKRDTAFFEMVELNIARETLVNESKRLTYDKSLKFENEPNEVSVPAKNTESRQSIFNSIHSLFKYRCRTCRIEMNSTWKGYCLYHYLEATSQLENEDFIFEYHGNLYQWADPPEELQKKRKNEVKKTSYSITKTHIFLYILLIISLCSLLAFLLSNMI